MSERSKLSGYESLDAFGVRLVARSSDSLRIRAKRLLRSIATPLAAITLLFGGGALAVAALDTGAPDLPTEYPNPAEVPDDPMIIREIRAGDGTTLYAGGDCPAYDRWYTANVAPGWFEGDYDLPRSDHVDFARLPKPPPGICAGSGH